MNLFQYVLSMHAMFCAERGGVYTVIPVTLNGLLDYEFHNARLYDSAQLLYGTSYRLSDCRALITESAIHAMNGIEDHSQGKLAIVLGQHSNDQQLRCNARFFPASYLNSCELKSCKVNFAEISRAPVRAKYTKWLVERQTLPRTWHNETLLLQRYPDKPSERLLISEGLTSNLGVVLDKDLKTIWTPSSEICLPGSMEHRVSRISEAHGYNWRSTDLDLIGIQQWTGAFLMSAGRGLHPITQLELPDNQGAINFDYNHESTVMKVFAMTNDFLNHVPLNSLPATNKAWTNLETLGRSITDA